MLNFHFAEKCLRLVSASHFVNNFSKNLFLRLRSINSTNLIVWMPLLLKILHNMCIKIVCLPGCGVKKFQINLIFLIKLFWYMTKNSRQKLKYLENKKRFWVEIKRVFHHFKRTFNCQKLPQSWEWVIKKKQREIQNKSLCLLFCMIFEEKTFILLYFITWPNTNAWLALIR